MASTKDLSLSEKLMQRSNSARGSVRESFSKAFATLRRASEASKTLSKHRGNSSESSSESSAVPRSASSSGSSIAQKSSSGFGSMTQLPPRQTTMPLSMSQSMYCSPGLLDTKADVYPYRLSTRGVPSSPSLTTLKDFDVGQDFDDTTSVISSASTSRAFGRESISKRYKTHTLRTFLNSPVRLRRRDPSKDAVEAGFEPPSAVPRCHSINSLAFNNSQFQPSDLNHSQNELYCNNNGRDAPTAVVSPRKGSRTTAYYVSASQSMQDHIDAHAADQRRSLQALNAAALFSGSSYSDWPGGPNEMEVHDGRMCMTPQRYDMNRMRPSFSCNSELFSISDSECSELDYRDKSHRRTSQNMKGSRQHINGSSSSPYFDNTVVTSTPPRSNKVAVAPQQQHRSHKSHRDGEHMGSGRNMQSVVPLERRSSNAGMHLPAVQSYLRNGGEERLVDGPPIPSSPMDNRESRRVMELEQRLQNLESAVTGQQNGAAIVIPVTPTSHSKHGHTRSSAGPPAQLIIANNSPASITATMTQQYMVKDIAEKEVEIEKLQIKLRKTYETMDLKQAEYDEDVRRFKKESDIAKNELFAVKNKLIDLEAANRECSASIEQIANVKQYREQIRQQEEEIQRLRMELAEKKMMQAELAQLRSQMEAMEEQNETLTATIDEKQEAVKTLEQNIVSMRLEASLYHQSCSSGSTPLADDTESLADVRPPLYSTPIRPYTKAHSTLGSNLSPLPTPKSGGLKKSLSNYNIDASKKDEVTGAMSQSLRAQQKKLVESRLLSKCLRETVERVVRGERPDVGRLLGIKTDSMSESEAEQVEFDSTAMSMAAAEKVLRRQAESMRKLEADLDAIRYAVQDLYQAKMAEKMTGRDEACNVQ